MPVATPDSEENRKWFINRIDSLVQNFIDIHETDSENFYASLEDADEGLILGTWQLIDFVSILAVIGFGWTLIVTVIRKAILPRMEKVGEAYDLAHLSLLYIQSWFQNITMKPSNVSQERLDLFYNFIKVAVASLYSTVFLAAIKFRTETRLIKPGEQLEPSLHRLNLSIQEGYQLFKGKRAELMNPDVFSPNLLSMLAPFDREYQSEQKKGTLKPAS